MGHPTSPGRGDPPEGAGGSGREGGAAAPELALPLPRSSLVSTNSACCRSWARRAAQAEVEQLHWSYKELEKTLARAPAAPGCPRPPPHAARPA